jgi:hypothetical protein
LWCDVDEYANEIAIFGHNSICAPVALWLKGSSSSGSLSTVVSSRTLSYESSVWRIDKKNNLDDKYALQIYDWL